MSILLDGNGFSVRGRAVNWAAVQAIATYKRDLFIHDDVCLAFQTDADTWVEVSEDEPGFKLLIAEVERRYPEVPRDWFAEVMLPPFAANYRVLWRVS
ncbi:MAG: hypothetical protein M3478_07095 [Planctomycetota bacterium]|nr:hypothetical protein [Planctomycetota bacterium]